MRMYLRSLFIQSLVNYRWMQGNAFRYVLRLNREEDSGSIPFFNTHPWLAPGLIALIANLHNVQTPGRDLESIRLRWMGTLGAVGDGVFWSTIRPLVILLGLVFLRVAPRWFWLIPFLFFCFSLWVRWQAIRAGGQGEESFYLWLERMRPRRVISVGRRVLLPAVFVAGITVTFFSLGEFVSMVHVTNGRWTALWLGLVTAVLLLKPGRRFGTTIIALAGLLYAGWYYVGV